MNWKLIRIVDACLGIPLLLGISLADKLPGRRLPRESGSVNRVLLIKFWGIGNICMILPSLRALQATYPDATFDFLTLTSNRAALEATAALGQIATIDTGSISAFLASWRYAVATLRGNGYDLIIDFEQFTRFSALVSRQIGAGQTIGFVTAGQHRHHLFTRPVPYDNTVHITRSFFALAAAAGVAEPCSPHVTFASLPLLRSRGAALLAATGIRPGAESVVVMHIGTSDNFRERRWLPERYAALADLLIERHRARVVLTGLPEEAFLIRETLAHLRSPEGVVDLGGALPFTDYFALIAVADLVVSADTAAVHLASAVNTPVAGLYGPNTPLLYGPWGTDGLALYAGFDCSPCITNFNAKIHTCRHPAGRGACMRALGVAAAFAAIEERWFRPGAPCHRLNGGRC
jgi:ADP-heptose:LPS heptosyltransferase